MDVGKISEQQRAKRMREHCKGCIYYMTMIGTTPICDYASATGELRGGSVFDCTKKQIGKRRRAAISIK
ncbi:MAG: hypothetical protein RSC06_11500 [Clostridia bacterium]